MHRTIQRRTDGIALVWLTGSPGILDVPVRFQQISLAHVFESVNIKTFLGTASFEGIFAASRTLAGVALARLVLAERPYANCAEAHTLAPSAFRKATRHTGRAGIALGDGVRLES